jgi:aconitate hydratase
MSAAGLLAEQTLRPLTLASGETVQMHALAALADLGVGDVSRLPVSLRVVLESLMRHLGSAHVTETHVRQLVNWQPHAERHEEIPFIVARILLQDFTGVPLLCDLAAMRDAATRFGRPAQMVEPLVQVDLVIDHSVQVDHFREHDAFDLNMRLEFQRNAERYRFIKWGMQAFSNVSVVPPGIGIVHQVNLESLARGVRRQGAVLLPDSLVGTDSHTTMINALGVVAWGVGGIEAEAGMLGQPISFLTPDVVGVHLSGRLRPGTTATDLVLLVTQRLRAFNVVGQFVEFFGEGAASLTLPDRATLANMAPEYGATMGFFPPDEVTVDYLRATGRTDDEIDAFRRYFQAQGLFGMPGAGQIDYSRELVIDLAAVEPSVAGPKRPQDRIALSALAPAFAALLNAPASEGGYGRAGAPAPKPAVGGGVTLADGDVLVAAITSCTNTSNPGLMLTAGLLARKALARGLRVAPHVKTSLAPGSRVVTDYLQRADLLAPLQALGFRVVAYGCTTCIGNSGPLDAQIEAAVMANDLICASVLSGNRNFEARIHPALRANFLMSPPLVVAFALAGRLSIDLSRDPLGIDREGRPVWLGELWPDPGEIASTLARIADPQAYRRLYAPGSMGHPMWDRITTPEGKHYLWEDSTYIARPPFLDDMPPDPAPRTSITAARALALFGDSVTTDHISPAGAIAPDSPAGRWLQAKGVAPGEFNSYGSRRGHHEVMVRGTFANVRLRNLAVPADAHGRAVEGGWACHQPDGVVAPLYDVAVAYQRMGTPMIIFAGEEYGTGSSRDWAAKGTRLLGVRAVVARSFERIHRANLVGMGVLPLQFVGDEGIEPLHLRGDELFDLPGVEGDLRPGQSVTLVIWRANGRKHVVALKLRVDTPMEVEYLRHGGILPYALRALMR